MEFSEADRNVIQRLRTSQRSWRLARWAALFVGALMIGASVFLFQGIWSTVAYDQILLLLCVLVAPALGIVLFLGLAAVLYVFLFWNGRPNDKLLLRLVDEVESRGSS
jgi:hypothetical protein